jgi:tRNA A-37 threonylcarbamoyl transferase component Bud32
MNDDSDDSGLSFGDMPEDFGRSPEATDESSSFPEIPGYTIVRMIGRGGMGAVYEARQNAFSEISVALKTISVPRFQKLHESIRKRFDREVQLLASLKHPSIVPLLDQGVYDKDFQSIPYFVMPYLTGGDLSDLLMDNPSQRPEQLHQTVTDLCEIIDGLAMAHREGIIHRDLKPKNIFISPERKLVLGDFGLAKVLEEDSELTSTIGHMGTTPYAPPEQLLSAKLIDARADIYALGVILFQMACQGARPFAPDHFSDDSSSESDSIARWHRSNLRRPPQPSDRSKKLTDASYDFIVQKCLSYAPEHRYQTADELALDLRRWLRGEKVRGTFQERWRYRLLYQVRPRLKRVAAIGALVLVILIGLVAGRMWQLSDEASQERLKKAQLSEQRTSELREELNQILPRLAGEDRDHETRRAMDVAGEFKRQQDRAEALSAALDLAGSDDLTMRHQHWVIEKSGRSPGVDVDYVRRLRQLVTLADESWQTALSRGSDEQKQICLTDLLRSLRLELMFAWYIADDPEGQQKLADVFDWTRVIAESRDQLARLAQSSWVQKTPRAQRYVRLLALEAAVKDPKIEPRQAYDTLVESQDEFTAGRLQQDDCRSRHPWYVAWYLFQELERLSRRLDRPFGERRAVTERWMTLQVEAPYLDKRQNFTYFNDLHWVRDIHGDTLRSMGLESGDVVLLDEAAKTYEESWEQVENLLFFYSHDPKSWGLAEAVISSLIVLYRDSKDRVKLTEAFQREEQLLREQWQATQENPGSFESDYDLNVRADLARSLMQAADELEQSESDRGRRLREALQLLTELLEESPDHELGRKLRVNLVLLLEKYSDTSIAF